MTPQQATNLSWESPAFIVNKKNDVLGRVVVDYTQVNTRTEEHASIAPDGARILEKAAGKNLHTVLDLVWGFSQFPIDDDTRDALTICSSRGLRQWRFLPMGPKQGPGICQSFCQSFVGDLEEVSVFIDDFHVGSDEWEQHLRSLEELMKRGRKHGVQWRLAKTKWAQPEVILVGFKVSAAGKQADPEKVLALKNWPAEKSLEDLSSLFAYANYLREFITVFVEITSPLRPYGRKEHGLMTTSRTREQSRLRGSCGQVFHRWC